MKTERQSVAQLCAIVASLSMTLIGVAWPGVVSAQSAPATAQPSPSALQGSSVAQAAPAGDESKLTPAELEKIEEAVIKESENPVGNIALVPFQNNFNFGVGPYQRLQYNISLLPVVPIMLNKDWNLIARTIIPVIDNPSFAPPAVCASAYGCGSTFGIGDINPQFFFAPSNPGALKWGAGPQFLFPTGSPSSLSAGKYGIGPALAGVVMPGHIVTGGLITQTWSIGGDPTKPGVSVLFIQPIFEYNYKHGWALFVGSSGITDNFNATPEQGKWNVPIGAGTIKTFKLGEQPMQISLLYFANVVRTTSSPTGTIRFQWSLIYPIKRGHTAP